MFRLKVFLKESVYYLFIDVIKMNDDFNKFYHDTIMKTQNQESEIVMTGSGDDDIYENSVCLSKQETIFMRRFDSHHCFIITVPEEFIDNKKILTKNLDLLKDFVTRSFGDGK